MNYDKLREKAERIIDEEEWNDIETKKLDKDLIILKNERTGKITRLKLTDTEEDIRNKISSSYIK